MLRDENNSMARSANADDQPSDQFDIIIAFQITDV